MPAPLFSVSTTADVRNQLAHAVADDSVTSRPVIAAFGIEVE